MELELLLRGCPTRYQRALGDAQQVPQNSEVMPTRYHRALGGEAVTNSMS